MTKRVREPFSSGPQDSTGARQKTRSYSAPWLHSKAPFSQKQHFFCRFQIERGFGLYGKLRRPRSSHHPPPPTPARPLISAVSSSVLFLFALREKNKCNFERNPIILQFSDLSSCLVSVRCIPPENTSIIHELVTLLSIKFKILIGKLNVTLKLTSEYLQFFLTSQNV